MATQQVVPDSLPDRRREQRGWYFYDWANSAFPTTVLTVFLGPYLTTIAETAARGRPYVDVLWFDVRPSAYYSFVVGAAAVLQIVLMPVAGVDRCHVREVGPVAPGRRAVDAPHLRQPLVRPASTRDDVVAGAQAVLSDLGVGHAHVARTGQVAVGPDVSVPIADVEQAGHDLDGGVALAGTGRFHRCLRLGGHR